MPLALYVHIPWCVRKCPYCDFNSHVARAAVDQAAYVDALLADLDHDLAGQRLPEVGSVFIGGGTPSLFDGAAIARLLDGVAARLALSDEVEITLEANPGTAEAGRFAAYRAAGVNRLSLGVQSLDDAGLRALGRIHTADEARTAYAMARRAGFDNVNIDLMFGLPGQGLQQAIADLDAVIALAPEHLSWYQLTLEPNTLFQQRPPPRLPDDDRLADMAERGQARLQQTGYRRYEVSAYARAGHACRHNLNYWQFGDYLGIGAGAHGKLTLPHRGIRRRSKCRGPDAYVARAGAAAATADRWLDAADLPVEFLLNALRLVDGVPTEWFERRTGVPLASIGERLAVARGRGLLGERAGRLQPTALGLNFLNDLLAIFEPG